MNKGGSHLDSELNGKFEHVSFSPEVTNMFSSILHKNDLHRLILRFIATKQVNRETCSIIDLTESIKTERRVRVNEKNNVHYVVRNELIDRKTAERLVDKMSSMSLIHYEVMSPYKWLHLTKRGAQVLKGLEEKEELKTKVIEGGKE